VQYSEVAFSSEGPSGVFCSASCEANNQIARSGNCSVSHRSPCAVGPVRRGDRGVQYGSTRYSERLVHRNCVVNYVRKNVVEVLKKAGFLEAADEAALELPDPVDFERFEEWAMKRGITRDALMSAMGGSP
jgi:hypothetical protein